MGMLSPRANGRYNYALSPTSQFYFCGVPLRLDVTPKCPLDCLYCFAMARGGRRTRRYQHIDPERLKRKLDLIFLRGKTIDLASELVSRRVPIHFGGISDPFSDDMTSNLARECIRELGRYGCPVVLSTKNTFELARDETLSLLKGYGHISVQVSISTSNDAFAAHAEPRVPTPDERVNDIAKLANEGIHCACRVQPLIAPEIQNVSSDLIPAVAAAGCSHVIVEFLKLPVEKNISLVREFEAAVDWDAYDYYRAEGAKLVGREWLLPPAHKWELLQPVLEAIRSHGMTYGAGDYGLHHLGDTRCCCGVDRLPGFGNWFKGSIANLVTLRRGRRIGFSRSGAVWFPEMSLRRIMNSRCRLKSTRQDMKGYIEAKWNSPGTANAPDAYLGVRWSGERDENGDCIYIRKGDLL